MPTLSLFLIDAQQTQRLEALPEALPKQGFIWWATTRNELEAKWVSFHAQLQRLTHAAPIDLHQQDLLNAQHPSHYDYTSDYDLIIFRRLMLSGSVPEATTLPTKKKSGPAILKHVVTQPVGFLLYDRVLVTVHPDSCATAEDFVRRMGTEAHARRPTSPADLMLRMVNAMVDGYLDLRKTLSAQLDHWQIELMSPSTRFVNWRALLTARNDLHALEDLCDEQHDAMQEWLDTLQEQPLADNPSARTERDSLVARSRDVIEHVERVMHHVRRLQQSAETAVQIHFSAQSNRTNDIMRTLTAITAVFLPLNLITGFFGMNFEFMPFIHNKSGFWWAFGAMLFIATVLVAVFWRKRYLARTRG
ncbi:MAG: magnesium transporter CorA family protein [Burkholderiaceae bacterium]